MTTEGSRGLGKVVEDATKYGLRIEVTGIKFTVSCSVYSHCFLSLGLTHFSVKFSGQPEVGVNDGWESLRR